MDPNKVPGLRLAHIINPFKASPGSDLEKAQPITFRSMQLARERAEEEVSVELWAACFEADRAMVPEGFECTSYLDRSVQDKERFVSKKAFPLIADILDRLYRESTAEYLIYTNVDIGLYPDFYRQVAALIRQGHDAFIINRRRIPEKYFEAGDLEEIFREKGKSHPGFDCFVFHRDLYPRFCLEGICIGVPFIGITLAQNLFALARNFRLFEREVLTFHIGMELYLGGRAPKEFFRYNRKEFWKAIACLWPEMSARKLPYSGQLLPIRILRWGLHPSIPIRLALKLEWKRLWHKE